MQLHKETYLTPLRTNNFKTYHPLFKENEYFTDREIDMVNSCSKYRYPSKNVLILKSSHLQILAVDNIIESVHKGKGSSNNDNPNIVTELFEKGLSTIDTIERSGDERQTQDKHKYICWNFGSSKLMKKITGNKFGRYSMITANISLLDHHWVFMVGIDFYDRNSKN